MNDFRFGTLKEIVGENVRRLRLSNGLSQDELSEKARIHRTYLVRLESSGGANITLDVLEALAHALNVGPTDLLDPDAASFEEVSEEE